MYPTFPIVIYYFDLIDTRKANVFLTIKISQEIMTTRKMWRKEKE